MDFAKAHGEGMIVSPTGGETMAKGQLKGNREAKKPKADKSQPKGAGSAYKQAQGKGSSSPSPFVRKS
jgi:hypothetical protein